MQTINSALDFSASAHKFSKSCNLYLWWSVKFFIPEIINPCFSSDLIKLSGLPIAEKANTRVLGWGILSVPFKIQPSWEIIDSKIFWGAIYFSMTVLKFLTVSEFVWSVFVKTTIPARDNALIFSRNIPAGISLPEPKGQVASIKTISKSRAKFLCWKASSAITISQPDFLSW